MSNDQSRHTPKDSHYARLRRAHREQQAGGTADGKADTPTDGLVRLYGLHTVRAAIQNPNRTITRLLATRNALERLEIGDAASLPFSVEMVEPRAIDALTGADAVHQGVLAEAEPLAPKTLSALGDARLVLVLDQITDPHNVGAILRSAVAFSADALVTTARHSPNESGVLAKAASGALEQIDMIEVRNLAETIKALKAGGFLTVGLDSEGAQPLERAFSGEKIALVLGSEGKGMRHRTRDTVDVLSRLDMPGPIKSLNVSNAAAIALYAANAFLAASRSQ